LSVKTKDPGEFLFLFFSHDTQGNILGITGGGGKANISKNETPTIRHYIFGNASNVWRKFRVGLGLNPKTP
jgi:hypothetical protein